MAEPQTSPHDSPAHEYSKNPSNNPSNNPSRNPSHDADEVVISIPSDASYIRVVRLAVMGIASRMALSFEDIEDIKLAVSEACNNAVLHARPTNLAKSPVVVRLRTFDDRLEISVEDDGHVPPPGLAPSRHVAPTSPHELPEGGMGLFLIETLMDKVEHETGDKTVVRMTKRVSPHALAAKEIDITQTVPARLDNSMPATPTSPANAPSPTRS